MSVEQCFRVGFFGFVVFVDEIGEVRSHDLDLGESKK